jgi:hypothetical protein
MTTPNHVDYETLEAELFALLDRYTDGENGTAAICALVEVAMKVFRLAGTTAARLTLAQAALLVVLNELRDQGKVFAASTLTDEVLDEPPNDDDEPIELPEFPFIKRDEK